MRVDLEKQAVTGRVAVGREPRSIAITPDGSRLVVSNSRSRDLSVVALASFTVERTLPIEVDAANLRQVAVAPDGLSAYVANMRNMGFATTSNNIDKGWVLGQRISRVALDGSQPFEALAIDPQGRAAGDAYGMAVSPDGRFLAVGCGGTHEVMLFRTDMKRLPWRVGSSRDVMLPELANGDGRFRRVATGGRPTELAFAPDGKTLYVANYLEDAVQVRSTTRDRRGDPEHPAGASCQRSRRGRVGFGEEVFHDATKSFNQWYSCNTCHSDGHSNGLDFDTLNDGRQDLSTSHKRSRKKVPTLRRVTHTAPWTWHGWQAGLDSAAYESFTKSMQGKRPSNEDVQAIVAYLDTLEYPRNPFREKDGALSAAASRGEAVFRSAKAACNTCHGGAELTDGKIHVVGLEAPDDAYRGYNPPSLRGLYDKAPFLHDGRSRTLRDALTGPHSPDSVTGLGELTAEELDDLLVYLKSLVDPASGTAGVGFAFACCGETDRRAGAGR